MSLWKILPVDKWGERKLLCFEKRGYYMYKDVPYLKQSYRIITDMTFYII